MPFHRKKINVYTGFLLGGGGILPLPPFKFYPGCSTHALLQRLIYIYTVFRNCLKWPKQPQIPQYGPKAKNFPVGVYSKPPSIDSYDSIYVIHTYKFAAYYITILWYCPLLIIILKEFKILVLVYKHT